MLVQSQRVLGRTAAHHTVIYCRARPWCSARTFIHVLRMLWMTV